MSFFFTCFILSSLPACFVKRL